MNSKNSGASDPHTLLLNLAYKVNLKGSDECVTSSNISIYYTWKNIRKSCKNDKFKISAPKWNEKFQLSDGSSSVYDIHNPDNDSVLIILQEEYM